MTTITLWRSVPRLLAAGVFLVASIFVAACTSPQRSQEVEPVTLSVLMTDDWGDRPAFLAAVKDFERAHKGVRVQIDRLPIRNMEAAVKGRINQGDPPDVVQWHAYAAGAQGLAEPLDDLWRKAGMKISEFFPGAVADVRWAGRLYGVPLDINALVIFFHPEPFARANLQPPGASTTFSDLERYGATLSSQDGSRRLLAVPNSYWAAYGWIRANGGELVRLASGKPVFTLDSPQVVEALAFLSRMVKQGYAFAPAGATSSADALALFRVGSSIVHASGSWTSRSWTANWWGGATARPLCRPEPPAEPVGALRGAAASSLPGRRRTRSLLLSYGGP